MQVPLQSVCPAGQATHWPFWQVWLNVHRMPQPPQFSGSELVSIQLLEQHVLSPHSVLQFPQWRGSLLVSVQVPKQFVWPDGQVPH